MRRVIATTGSEETTQRARVDHRATTRTILTGLIALSFILAPRADFSVNGGSASAEPRHYHRPPAHRNVHHHHHVHRTVVVAPVRPVPAVRPWYWGSVVAGVTIGTIIVVSASTVPKAPSPDLCWYWDNPSKTRGYWDYCIAPTR